MERVGYRTGQLIKKSDYICQFTGGNRSTGYFGTGYYFCTTPQNCITISRKDRELLKLTFKDNLHWFEGTVRNHDLLKQITRFVTNYDLIKDEQNLKNIYWLSRRLNDLLWNNDPGSEVICTLQSNYESDRAEGFCKNFKEFKEDFQNREWKKIIELISEIPELEELTNILSRDIITSDDFDNANTFVCQHKDYFSYEFISGLDELRRDVLFRVELYLNVNKGFFLKWAGAAYQYYIENGRKEMDSIPTLFLKSLQYEGVWPTPECDDTTYGGVIFEKENIKEITVMCTNAEEYKSLDENKKVVIEFLNDEEGKEFRAEMKNRFGYPKNLDKHQIFCGKGKKGGVFVEKELKEEVYINTPEKISQMHIITEDDPQTSRGSVQTGSKRLLSLVNTFLQKEGLKLTQATEFKSREKQKGITLGNEMYATVAEELFPKAIEAFHKVGEAVGLEVEAAKGQSFKKNKIKENTSLPGIKGLVSAVNIPIEEDEGPFVIGFYAHKKHWWITPNHDITVNVWEAETFNTVEEADNFIDEMKIGDLPSQGLVLHIIRPETVYKSQFGKI